MNPHRIVLILSTIIICSTSVALGYIYGSSNLDLFGYPEFSRKHIRPYPPYSRDTYSINSYRSDVEMYLQQAKTYIEAANNDIERITEAKRQAMTDVNDVVDEYNRFVQGY